MRLDLAPKAHTKRTLDPVPKQRAPYYSTSSEKVPALRTTNRVCHAGGPVSHHVETASLRALGLRDGANSARHMQIGSADPRG